MTDRKLWGLVAALLLTSCSFQTHDVPDTGDQPVVEADAGGSDIGKHDAPVSEGPDARPGTGGLDGRTQDGPIDAPAMLDMHPADTLVDPTCLPGFHRCSGA